VAFNARGGPFTGPIPFAPSDTHRARRSIIRALVQIMQDTNIFRRKRIEACEGLLGYEAPPDTANLAKEFLASVFEDQEADVSDRLDALALTRKFEAKKIAPQTVHLTRREEADRKEAWREYEINQLQTKIVLATMDHPPKGSDAELRSPDYLPPPGDEWPPSDRGPDGKLILFRPKERADRTKQTGLLRSRTTPHGYCISNLLVSKNSFPNWGFVNSFPTWGFVYGPFVDLSI